MRDKMRAEESIMSASYIRDTKSMAKALLDGEFRGPGDTIDAAASRLQVKFGVPATVIKRLRHREVKDMLLSNFVALASAYKAATERMERAYEHERKMAVDPRILRLADLVVGSTNQEEDQ